MAMDAVEYRVCGAEMQFVELVLDPGEAAVGEAGTMFFMEDGIEHDTVFGDTRQDSGLAGKLAGAGRRLLTGESMFSTVYTNRAQSRRRVAFAAPYPGRIVAVSLSELGGRLLCQRDAFLCAARGVSLGVAFQRRLGVGLFGGEGFILQEVSGDGLAFIHAGGTLVEKTLPAGKSLLVDAGCVVAFEPQVDFDIEFVGSVKSALFGGEGLFFARLRGPGRVWLQSLPMSRLAGRLAQAMPPARESIKGGLLGGILSGDD